jgi:hypothetical protein
MVTRRFLILFCAALTSCATVPDQPRLTAAEVIRLADAEARRDGYDLRAYERPRARYNFVTRDHTWWVKYEGKSVNGMSPVGNHFSVTIEDKTKKLWLIPGR